MIKYFAVVAMAVVALTGCQKDENYYRENLDAAKTKALECNADWAKAQDPDAECKAALKVMTERTLKRSLKVDTEWK
ncbi:hypothetical protein [Kistimonas asteriae]|uniref:hypothetical protein n=1 Tax=Kistimonas asteriae TaxID=517724 RepID=UPI001BA7A4B1|nr:hypothetical protein [Kistimonas asteriae]